jgi:HAMP domain-containing protein
VEWTKLWLDFLSSVAWPAIAGCVLIAFRKPISARIEDLRKAELGALKLELDRRSRRALTSTERAARKSELALQTVKQLPESPEVEELQRELQEVRDELRRAYDQNLRSLSLPFRQRTHAEGRVFGPNAVTLGTLRELGLTQDLPEESETWDADDSRWDMTFDEWVAHEDEFAKDFFVQMEIDQRLGK